MCLVYIMSIQSYMQVSILCASGWSWIQIFLKTNSGPNRILILLVGCLEEMFGLIIASLKLNLPFTMTPSFVVSEPAGVQREMWRYIDKLSAEDVCKPPISSVPWPLALHYCQRYNLGKVRRHRIVVSSLHGSRILNIFQSNCLLSGSFPSIV